MSDEMVITRYTSPGKRLGLNVALVTDLHNCDHTELLRLLKEVMPDLILCAGDILERHEEGASKWTIKSIEVLHDSIGKRTVTDRVMWLIDRLVEHNGVPTYEEEDIASVFLREASEIAPIYYSIGNHEWYFIEDDQKLFKECGITVLDNEDCEVEIRGKQIRFGGISPWFDLDWVRRFSQKPGYKILLCHYPEYYRKLIKDTDMDTFDLVVSGHFHGGQWRVGGRCVYIPRIGLLVKDGVGQFGKLIISAGTANTTKFPRYGNPCELVMIEI